MRQLLRSIDSERPVLIAGPTASGKSALALEIASARGGMIVNADALQVYGCWRILTARPSTADETSVEHRLYGHVGAEAPYSVGAWLGEVEPLLAARRPVIVGGTGLYFTRLTRGLVDLPPVPEDLRREAAQRDPASLLAEIDDETRRHIDAANPARIRRAWEVERATGRGLSDWHRETPRPLLPLHAAQAFVVEMDRATLAARIAQRADSMLHEGAVEEVREVLSRYGDAVPAMKAIGAREIAGHIQAGSPLGLVREQVSIATRRYAKRQRTWFRSNMKDWTPLAA